MKKLFKIETKNGVRYATANTPEEAQCLFPGTTEITELPKPVSTHINYPDTITTFPLNILAFHARSKHFPDQMLCISETSTGLGYIQECHYDSLATLLFTLYEQLRYHRLFKPGRISISTFANRLLIERDGWIRVVETEGFPAAEVIHRAIQKGETWHIYWEVRSNG